MNTFKKKWLQRTAALSLVVSFSLSGCATSPPIVAGPTPTSLRTLKSYPSNKFAVISTDASGRQVYILQSTGSIWAYGFLMPGGHYAIYNALDIKKLISLNKRLSFMYGLSGRQVLTGPIEVVLRDGRAFTTAKSTVHLYECSDTRHCHAPSVNSVGYLPLQAIYADDLNKLDPSSFVQFYHSFPGTFLKPAVWLAASSDTASVEIVPNIARIQNRIENFLAARRRALMAREQAQNQARERFDQRVRTDTVAMRRHIKVGTVTNCGPVFDVRGPMIGVQTVQGMQYIALKRLYSPDVGCQFNNDVYVGPIYPSR